MLTRYDLAFAELTRHVRELAERVSIIEQGLSVEAADYLVRGFTHSEARILAMLMKREVVSRAGLSVLLHGAAPEHAPGEKAVDILVSRIRGRLAAAGLHGNVIRSRRSVGWSIAADDKARVRSVLGLPPMQRRAG